ncbi:MAG: type II secretion system protein, partial [Armatimonadetes bacterium]|nr:type II secretion system protein [Armatimonadota bacterium]
HGLVSGVVTICTWQVIAIFYFWPRYIDTTESLDAAHQLPRRRQSGATLVSTLVSLFIISLCLTMFLQAYVQGKRARAVQERHMAGLAVCQERVEMARARGYAALRAAGDYPFPVESDIQLSGVTHVEPGPVAGSKQVTVTVRWLEGEQTPAGEISLSTIMSAQGVGG